MRENRMASGENARMARLTEQVRADLTESMKARTAERTSTLRMLQSAFKYEQIQIGHELSDEEALAVVRKNVKQRHDSIEQYTKGNRPDLAAKEQAEIEILKTYLPPELSEAELEAGLREIIASTGAQSKKDLGKVMKEATAKYKGRADGKAIQAIVSRLLPAVLLFVIAVPLFAANRILPAWFPENLFTINPDNMTVEDFGTDTFKVGKAEAPQDVPVKGKHFAGSLYPPGPTETWDKWNGVSVFAKVRAQLESEGFKVVFLNADADGAHGTFRRGTGPDATYVDLRLTKDAYSNGVAIIEPAAHARALALKSPAPQPETFTDRQDIPYLTPLAGAKLLDTHYDNGPMDVSGPNDTEPRLVGTGTIAKQYEGPPNVSPLDFTSTYETALRNAGWAITTNTGGALTAHYAKSGRDIWAKLTQVGSDVWYITIADVGSSLRSALEKNCKVALYGINFDFNKATIRPDSEPVLEQVLAVMKPATTPFEIDGHTDNVGTPAYNDKLSQDRADAVKGWLVAHGIAAGRLTARGFGEKAPLVANNSDANRARNRRVELKKPGC